MSYKTKEKRREYYNKNKNEINKKRREYCNRSEVRKKLSIQDKIWREKNKEKIKKYNIKFGKIYRDKLKNLALDHYGRKCACCGEENLSFLSIDHINGGGRRHRKVVGNHICIWLHKNSYPKGFQTLCFNCNMGKYFNGGICPHKTKPVRC